MEQAKNRTHNGPNQSFRVHIREEGSILCVCVRVDWLYSWDHYFSYKNMDGKLEQQEVLGFCCTVCLNVTDSRFEFYLIQYYFCIAF